MKARIPSPGDIIDAYCTSCRTVMNHTIVAMVNGRPARVQCNTCGGTHNYRAEKSAAVALRASAPRTPSAAAAPRQPRRDPGAEARQEWAALELEKSGDRALPYDMKARYKVGGVVRHPKFGLGVVRQLPGANKVEILFEEGLKLLRCG